MASKDIKDCDPKLQLGWVLLKSLFEEAYPGWKMVLTCTHRTPEEQFDLYKKGRTLNDKTKIWEITDRSKVVTFVDGVNDVGKHNTYPAQAFDVAIQNPQDDFIWDTKLPQWGFMIKAAKQLELENGGSWKKFKDYPHFETV